jgi:phage terminase small subunit
VNFLPRAKNAKAEIALKLYRQGTLLKDIAEKLDVPQGTVRRWKNTYKWDGEDVRKNSERSENNERSERPQKNRQKEAVAEDVQDVCENAELTDKQRLFCLYYVKCFNATKAYQKAYGCNYETAASVSYRMLENVGVRNEINRLKQNRMNRELIDENDIFQKYMDIAFADIKDYVTFGTEEVPVMAKYGPVQVEDETTGEKRTLTQTASYVRPRESNEVDGSIISEIKQGRNGFSVKLADRMKALEWLGDHMGIATEEQKARIAALRAKTEVNNTEEVDTSYVDALKELAAKVWDDEKED